MKVRAHPTGCQINLDKVIAAAPDLVGLAPIPSVADPSGQVGPNTATGAQGPFSASLVSHLKARGGDKNQNAKFLATADWLRRRGESLLSTSKVTKALSENQQKRLGNASECLNQNVGKGFCEKK